jgi:hypothetical protein
LALQVRQGNLAQAKETYRAYVTEINQVLFSPMTDPTTMALLQKGARDFESLNRRDQGMTNAGWSPLFILAGEIFAARKQGTIDPQLSHQLDFVVASFLQMPGLAAWWGQIKPFWDPVYIAHVEALLASPECPPPVHEMLPWYMPDDAGDEAES